MPKSDTQQPTQQPTQTEKQTRNKLSIEDSLTTLTRIEQEGLPKKMGELIKVGTEIQANYEWWQRRGKGLIESLKEAQVNLKRFEAVIESINALDA